MSCFRPHEIAYLNASDLGRLATLAPDGTVQNSPVGFTFNPEFDTIDVSGYRMSKSRKYRNVATNPRVAFVVDDIVSREPHRVRCLEIRGTAAQVRTDDTSTEPNGDTLDTAIIRITPDRIIGFGIDDPDTAPHLLTPDARNVSTTDRS